MVTNTPPFQKECTPLGAPDILRPVPTSSTRTGRRRAGSGAAADSGVALLWNGKDRGLELNPAGGYCWATGDPQSASEPNPSLVTRSWVGTMDDSSENLLVLGDALDAIRCLEHSEGLGGTVRLAYIDPPFNRGEDFAHYDDALDHGVWLSMLRDRLLGIRDLLSSDGSVWLHLDDASQHYGRCLLDEVFGPKAFVATVIWQRRTSRDNRTAFSAMHDYIHVYAPAGASAWKRSRNALPDCGRFANPDGDPRGPWRSVPMSAQSGHATARQFYTVVSPTGVEHDPPPGRCWTYSRERFEQLVGEGRVYWPRKGSGKPRLKRYAQEATGLSPSTIWLADEVGENAHAKKDMLALFSDRSAFDTPKPESLLERIIHIGSDPGDRVLDCFVGSGTTAAVAHKMGRRWIGVERSDHVFHHFTLPRLTAVVQGNDDVGISRRSRWTGGGGFRVAEVQAVGTRRLSA